MDGGGVISYVKNTLIFEKVDANNKDGTQIAILKVKLARNKWVHITNV